MKKPADCSFNLTISYETLYVRELPVSKVLFARKCLRFGNFFLLHWCILCSFFLTLMQNVYTINPILSCLGHAGKFH